MWNGLSIKKKVIILLLVILLGLGSAVGISVGVINSTLNDFKKIMENNLICTQVQEAIEEENRAFYSYVREVSAENWQAFETACEKTETAISKLPFEYGEIGEERYARTWNIINGYDGYREYRDKFLENTENIKQDVDGLYRLFDMQDNLSDYATRLVQITMKQGNDIYSEQAEFYSKIPMVILGLTGVAVLVIVFLLKKFALSVVNPLLLLAQQSREIAKNNLEVPDLELERQDEMGELTQAFNKMKQAMRQYISTLEAKNTMAELLHKEEMEKLEMEKNLEVIKLEVLKSQVNPHFLFNTLNMISGMAKIEDAETTDKMIICLGNLFRYNLRTKAQEVYLENEIEAVEDYIYIQQMRFEHRIQYRKIICVDVARVKIPSFTLQPLVENAVVHGLSHKEDGGIITLKAFEKDGKVILTIADNGDGMTREELTALNERIRRENTSGRGIGLGNICRRISMLYEQGAFKVYSKAGKGTVIRIEIPQ